jgi:hypothetical protein
VGKSTMSAVTGAILKLELIAASIAIGPVATAIAAVREANVECGMKIDTTAP